MSQSLSALDRARNRNTRISDLRLANRPPLSSPLAIFQSIFALPYNHALLADFDVRTYLASSATRTAVVVIHTSL